MALVNITIIETVVVAGGIHTFAATLALPAAGMNLDRHARADFVFIDARPERDDGAHVFMTGREIFIEWQAALN
jgi:hypothetical protein